MPDGLLIVYACILVFSGIVNFIREFRKDNIKGIVFNSIFLVAAVITLFLGLFIVYFYLPSI